MQFKCLLTHLSGLIFFRTGKLCNLLVYYLVKKKMSKFDVEFDVEFYVEFDVEFIFCCPCFVENIAMAIETKYAKNCHFGCFLQRAIKNLSDLKISPLTAKSSSLPVMII